MAADTVGGGGEDIDIFLDLSAVVMAVAGEVATVAIDAGTSCSAVNGRVSMAVCTDNASAGNV